MTTVQFGGSQLSIVMYSGSKSRVGFRVCFSGSGRVRGSTFRGCPPRVFSILGNFKVKFRINWRRGWFEFWFSGSGWVWGSNFQGCPPQVSGFWSLNTSLSYFENSKTRKKPWLFQVIAERKKSVKKYVQSHKRLNPFELQNQIYLLILYFIWRVNEYPVTRQI